MSSWDGTPSADQEFHPSVTGTRNKPLVVLKPDILDQLASSHLIYAAIQSTGNNKNFSADTSRCHEIVLDYGLVLESELPLAIPLFPNKSLYLRV